jgi:hypothetical protein
VVALRPLTEFDRGADSDEVCRRALDARSPGEASMMQIFLALAFIALLLAPSIVAAFVDLNSDAPE